MWFELVNLAHCETPVGTLPNDVKRLARMVQPAVARKMARLTEDLAQLAPSLAEDRRKVCWINEYIEARIAQRGGFRRTAQDLHEAIQSCIAEDRKGRFQRAAS